LGHGFGCEQAGAKYTPDSRFSILGEAEKGVGYVLKDSWFDGEGVFPQTKWKHMSSPRGILLHKYAACLMEQWDWPDYTRKYLASQTSQANWESCIGAAAWRAEIFTRMTRLFSFGAVTAVASGKAGAWRRPVQFRQAGARG
jgi:hypothetical protein